MTPTFTGQDLFNLAYANLGGLSNAVSSDQLLAYLNRGKDAVWAILKANNDEYFLAMSQSTDSSADSYFGPLATDTREYTLPDDLREIKFIECLTSNYTDSEWVYKNATDPEFRATRRAATGNPSSTFNASTQFFYTIVDKDQFVMASYPPAAVVLTLWYIRALPDFEMSDTVDEILFPFNKLIAEYAAKRATLGTQDQAQFTAWSAEWKQSVIEAAQGSGPRNEADATFAIDFTGME